MDLLDELVAVNVTLEKWEKLHTQINSLNVDTSRACGFCDYYNCASDTCPAHKKCNEISIIYDAQYIIMKETKKNITWLKKRKTMLTKKIKAKEKKADA